ncbi:MAG: BON domain-containing protein [Thiohalocapsa sp.]|nr:BON domain-containing protein [Thiohalocapsa sp.]
MNSFKHAERLHKALANDPDTRPFADRIHLLPGEPWRIEGQVDSIAARRKVIRLARKSLPTGYIEDGVTLSPALSQSDEDLAKAVRDALREDSSLAGVRVLEPGMHPPPVNRPWVGVLVRDGIVHLGGWLHSHADKAVAEGLAWETNAARDVDNLIHCEPRRPRSDADIAEAAMTLIHDNEALKDQPIRVDVDPGSAPLHGQVEDAQRRSLARTLCWFVPAVRQVEDDLSVRRPMR